MMKKGLLALLLFTCSVFGFDINSVNNIPNEGTVALTFDDGPNPTYTPQILNILKKNHIQATFFVVGMNAKNYPQLIKKIHEEGHIIASHSQTHALLTKLSPNALEKEVATPSVIIEKIIGIRPKCLRYPFGASNHLVREEILKFGMKPTPMGFNSFDYERPGSDKIVSWITKNLHSKQVILMHDGFAKREQTVAALPQIIAAVKKKGLTFSAICA